MTARWIMRWLALALLAPATSVLGDDDLHASVTDTDTHRIPSVTVAPKYPTKARRDRIEGAVQVCFDINRKGRTRRIAVRHSTHRAFEKPSIRAVRASTFLPLQPDEPLQPIKSCRTFAFSLVPVEG